MAAHHQTSSSLSSSSVGSWSNEVFLCFHGKDTRTTFADHLYNALVDAGIRTFRDENALGKGKQISAELLDAIQQSSISIPIISKNYPKSKWCLDELAEISECRRTRDQTVLPIFYKIDPRDVRNQTKMYTKVFEGHQKQFGEKRMQKWKKALKEVGELDGWHSKKNTYEGKLIKEVVKTVLNTLSKRPLILSNKLVGIQSHIEEMLMLLDIKSNDRKIVGIHGLGGVGKTTIARAVYNAVILHFEGYSFIENVHENAQKHGLPHLQKQLISDILNQDPNITSVDDGIKVIQQRFCQRKVLIVLDDVNQDYQAKSLIGDGEWFGIGSKIIITSRDKGVLIAQKAYGIYEANLMNLDDSLELFSQNAFRMDQPPEDYLVLSKDIIKTTRGLPLAIQVIGSSLYLKEKSIWEEMLKKVQELPNDDVLKRLKISYDGLNEKEQQMFLDTACFFIGMNKDIAYHIWEGCGFFPRVGLETLCLRSLVKISEEGELRMHDHLRDLGREIVRQESIEPGKRTRIWFPEEVLGVLDTQTGTNNVTGLIIKFTSWNEQHLMSGEGFAAMTKLRLLQVDYAGFHGDFTHYFSELRWLSWKGCSDQYARVNFRPRKLVVLDLSHSLITEKWMGWKFIKMAAKLKVLNLANCPKLSRTPDLSANGNLKVLILECCYELVEIHTSIGYLRNLEILDMSGCLRLVDLPTEICQLTSLKTLDLSYCVELKSLSNLPQQLKALNLKGCKNLVEIDTSIGYLKNLVTLDMSGCESLKDLTIEVFQLTSLERLNLRHCFSLNKLPKELGRMISLTTLDLSDCMSLVELPIEICELTSLRSLILRRCVSLNTLPEKLGDLISLTTLDLSGCRRLVDLRMLSGLKNLKALSLVV